MKSVVIQPYSSLFETPRVQISQEAYQNSGIGIFNSEKIPFANRTGSAFAQNLVNLFVSRVDKLKKSGQLFPDKIHIYELGAGTGILAKRILDLLKSEHKDIYDLVILHLSDFSKPMISQLKSSAIFNNHKGHIIFEVIDATKPKFAHKPLLVYFTNLIDSFPTRQILIKDGQIFEIQIQTSLKKGAQIIDATSYPPEVLEEKEIAKVLSSPDIKHRLILAPQILTILKEDNKLIPIDEVSNMNKEELEDLKNLVNAQDKTQPFNYSYSARTVIRKIIQGLDAGGFIFFSDFGFTSDKSEKVLHLEFGLVFAFSVDFPSIAQIVETAGKTYLTENAPGYPQEMLIDTFLDDKKIEDLFKKESTNGLPEQVTNFLGNAKTILSKNKQITRLYNSLPKEVKQDYQVLNSLTLFLLQTGFYKEAVIYADLLFKNYGHTVGVIYYLAKGKVAEEHGELKVTKEFYKKAVGTKESLAYVYLGELYWKQKRFLKYIETIKEYLKYTKRGDYLKSIFLIALAEEKLYDSKTVKKTLQELNSIGQRLKTLSETEKKFLKEAKERMII